MKRNKHNKNKQLRIDSMTGVDPVHTHGLGLWNNPRKTWSCRCDEKLAEAFSCVAIAKFGSICNPIECFMAAIVGAYKVEQMRGVNPSITVNVGVMKIERNLRERRKMTKTVIETETELVETVACGFVGHDCHKPAVGKGIFKGNNREYLLCADHFAEAKDNRLNWSDLVVLTP